MTRTYTKLLLTAGLSVILGSQALTAQNLTVVAKVPFSFRSAGQVMPAGEYRISEKVTPGIYQVTDKETGHSMYASLNIPDGGPPTDSKLTFACYGHECVLTGISIQGATHSNSASKSSVEKNLSRNLRLATMISVPLRAR